MRPNFGKHRQMLSDCISGASIAGVHRETEERWPSAHSWETTEAVCALKIGREYAERRLDERHGIMGNPE